MDQEIMVKDMIEDGYKVIEGLRLENFDVRGAAWVRDDDKERWYLYIVSKAVDEQEDRDAYRKWHAIWQRMPDLSIDRHGARLIGTTHKIAQLIFDFYRLYPTFPYRKYKLPVWGGEEISEVQIYPPPS